MAEAAQRGPDSNRKLICLAMPCSHADSGITSCEVSCLARLPDAYKQLSPELNLRPGPDHCFGMPGMEHSKRCHHCKMIWYHMPCGQVEPCTHAGDTLCIILRIPKKFGLDFKTGCSCCRFSKAALKQLRTICLRNPCAVVAHEAQLRLDANLWALQDSC